MRYVLPFLVYSVHQCSNVEHKLETILPNMTYACDMISYTSRLEMYVNTHLSEKKLKAYCDILSKEMKNSFDASVDCHGLYERI